MYNDGAEGEAEAEGEGEGVSPELEPTLGGGCIRCGGANLVHRGELRCVHDWGARKAASLRFGGEGGAWVASVGSYSHDPTHAYM